MRTTPIALVLALAALAGGCGGGSSTSSSITRAQACAFANEANTKYKAAGQKIQFKFTNKKLLAEYAAARHELRSRLQTLQPLVSASERSQLERFVSALDQQEVVIAALARNDLAAARAHVGGLDTALFQATDNLARICGSR